MFRPDANVDFTIQYLHVKYFRWVQTVPVRWPQPFTEGASEKNLAIIDSGVRRRLSRPLGGLKAGECHNHP